VKENELKSSGRNNGRTWE